MKELLDLEPNDCRYPVNEGGPFLFCAEPSAKGSSYCAHHRDLCFRKVMEHGEGLAGLRMTPEHRAKIAAANSAGSNFDCEVCGKTFWRKPYAISRGENRFCSRVCSNRRHL